MSITRTRRALIAMAGVSAGVAAVAVAPAAAQAAPDPNPSPIEQARARFATALQTERAATNGTALTVPTCHGIRDFGAGTSVSLPIPATVDGGSIDCQLQNGNFNNAAVKVLQIGLHDCNGERDLAIDADFGPQTAAAVKRVQGRAGLTQDGIYDLPVEIAMQWGVYDRASGLLLDCG